MIAANSAKDKLHGLVNGVGHFARTLDETTIPTNANPKMSLVFAISLKVPEHPTIRNEARMNHETLTTAPTHLPRHNKWGKDRRAVDIGEPHRMKDNVFRSPLRGTHSTPETTTEHCSTDSEAVANNLWKKWLSRNNGNGNDRHRAIANQRRGTT